MIAICFLGGGGLQAGAAPEPYDFPAPSSGPVVDIATAPIIVAGVAGDSESIFIKNEGVVRTYTTFVVDRVERGNLQPNDEITIETLGGKTAELTHVSEHQPTFAKDQHSRLFLKPIDAEPVRYRVYGLTQGKQDEQPAVQAASGPFKSASHCGSGFCFSDDHEFWYFESLPVGYKVNPNTQDQPSGIAAAVQAGFNSWEESQSRMDWHYNGTSNVASISDDGQNVVFWHPGDACGESNFLACAQWYLGPAQDQIHGFDVEYNDGFDWTFTEGNFDIQSTAVHEAGHALSLAHIVSCAQVMGIVDEDTGCPDQRPLGFGDLNGVRTLYPANVWYLRNSNGAGSPDEIVSFGSATDIPLAGDWDGDGEDSPGIFRAPNQWFVDNNSDGVTDVSFTYGSSGDTPVVGDWDGDGDTTAGVKRGNAWHLSNDSDDPVSADETITWGSASDVFLGGNWDGVSGDTPGIFRPSTRQWFLNNNFDADVTDAGEQTFIYGSAGDVPVVGDWKHEDDCAGAPVCFFDTPGIWRSTLTEPNKWHLNDGFDGTAETSFAYGRRGNKLAGDWNDNDIDTIGVR